MDALKTVPTPLLRGVGKFNVNQLEGKLFFSHITAFVSSKSRAFYVMTRNPSVLKQHLSTLWFCRKAEYAEDCFE
jgi:hypothetical protein